MERPKRKDIRDRKVFTRIGYTYWQVFADHENHIYVYEMTKGDKHHGYELVRARKSKNPDGSIVYTYPSDEDFGVRGYYIYYGDEDRETEKILEYMNKWLTETTRQ